VKLSAPSKLESGNDMAVASWRTTVTFFPFIRLDSELANPLSISTHVSRSKRECRRSVVTPGPGPTSSTFDPRSKFSRTHWNHMGFHRCFPGLGTAHEAMSQVHEPSLRHKPGCRKDHKTT
jgi:hypothetical protein